MFDTIIKKTQGSINVKKIAKARKANGIMKNNNRPRRFVMIAFDTIG